MKRRSPSNLTLCLLTFLIVSFVFSYYTIQSAFAEGLKVSPTNPRYFEDSKGNIVYLTGSHTWGNFADGYGGANWSNYLNMVTSLNHNFFRLWRYETSVSPLDCSSPFTPFPYQRNGPGYANDGQLKCDLTKFDQTYFDRIRSRCSDAKVRGMYVSIMLFNGWSLYYKSGLPCDPWPYHPYNPTNNINGINGKGEACNTLANASVTAIQEAYVKKVIDSVNDLDNVLYEICNETNGGTAEMQWQQHMVTYIKNYEATLPNQHPVGITVPWPNGSNSSLFSSNADWISPNASGGYDSNPPSGNGTKVVVSDTDHIWGVGGDEPWVWKSFTRGLNVLYMDPYDSSANLAIRTSMGYARMYGDKMNLAAMIPSTTISSTSYCLANPGNEYLVYAPLGGTFTVNFGTGVYNVEWFSPSTGKTTNGGSVLGNALRSFTAPFNGDAVLYLNINKVTATYTLDASVVNGHGTIKASPPTGPYTQGTVVNLTATPEAGYQVKVWSGTDNDTTKDISNAVTMNFNRTVSVEFEPASNAKNKGGGGKGCFISTSAPDDPIPQWILFLVFPAMVSICGAHFHRLFMNK